MSVIAVFALLCFGTAAEVLVEDAAEFLVADGGLSLLQLSSRGRSLKHMHPSDDIDGDEVDLERDQPVSWPEELQFPYGDIPLPIHIKVWSFGGLLLDTGTSKLGNCTVDFSARDLKTHIPLDPDYDISDADVVIFALPNMLWDFPNNYVLPREKNASQMWVSTCMEPYQRPEKGFKKADCRLMHDPATMEFMDATSTYDMTTTIPALIDSTYVEDMLKAGKKPPDFSAKPSDELATLAFSDCTSEWRNKWLTEVMAEINRTGHKVLSYGQCFHNAEEADDEGTSDHSKHGWINPAAARPFKLVAENTLQPWYVTEKIWNALAEGAVPVYLGPPEVKKLMPQGSFLYVNDFPSTQALVQRMLAFTPADFAKAHAWRSKPMSEWGMWETTWLKGRHTMVNRFCEFAAKQKLAGKPFKSGKTPTAHDLPCCPADPSCCMSRKDQKEAL